MKVGPKNWPVATGWAGGCDNSTGCAGGCDNSEPIVEEKKKRKKRNVWNFD